MADTDAERSRRYRRNHPERKARTDRNYVLKARYGVDQAWWDAQYLRQNGHCAICGRADVVLGVDHNHDHGRVRALLCSNCNTGIGLLNDSPRVTLAALVYLVKHKIINVLKGKS